MLSNYFCHLTLWLGISGTQLSLLRMHSVFKELRRWVLGFLPMNFRANDDQSDSLYNLPVKAIVCISHLCSLFEWMHVGIWYIQHFKMRKSRPREFLSVWLIFKKWMLNVNEFMQGLAISCTALSYSGINLSACEGRACCRAHETQTKLLIAVCEWGSSARRARFTFS